MVATGKRMEAIQAYSWGVRIFREWFNRTHAGTCSEKATPA